MIKRSMLILLIFCFLLTGCSGAPSGDTERKILTLAVFARESQLQRSRLFQWVNQYNESQSEVKIEFIYYLDNYDNQEEALNQIKIEINAGKGPDMINFGREYSPLDASCGMMADLYPFLQADDTLDKEDFYYNILEAFEIDDSLYAIVPGYRIDSYVTVNGKLADLDSMNINQLMDAYQMLDEESILFPGETKKAVFGMLCYGSLENYIDWGAGTCSFNGDSFKDILRFANQFPLNLNIDNDFSAKEIISEGRVLLYPVCLDNVYETASIRMLFGETPAYIGYPVDSGCGSMASVADLAIGISATSGQKEEAWRFLASLLEKEFQDNVSGLPIRIDSLEQKLEEAMETEYDAAGEKTVKTVLRFEGEDPVNIYEISAEDAETLRAIIRKIEYNTAVDRNLYNILLEEVDYLFNEDRNIDDVADIIQNRAGVYIHENK